jgi:hypothetical protein
MEDDEKLKFVVDNIKRINEGKVSHFLNSCGPTCPFPNETELGYFLQKKFLEEIHSVQDDVWEIWVGMGFLKNKIEEIANQYFWNKRDLQRYLVVLVKSKILDELKKTEFQELVDAVFPIVDEKGSSLGFRLIRSEFKNVLKNSFNITLQCGFPVNSQNINSGVMVANAGDSAQFLFIARAILIGLNCSNVDVRSSRYDAIVDYKNKLFRIQVKGVSGNSISFKDRDRGGQGIDTSHERNRGKRISINDCDVYVAVDKTLGICYLIPMNWVETLSDDEVKSVPLSRVEKYKEKWDIFDELI